jgi:hypothetical protein
MLHSGGTLCFICFYGDASESGPVWMVIEGIGDEDAFCNGEREGGSPSQTQVASQTEPQSTSLTVRALKYLAH